MYPELRITPEDAAGVADIEEIFREAEDQMIQQIPPNAGGGGMVDQQRPQGAQQPSQAPAAADELGAQEVGLGTVPGDMDEAEVSLDDMLSMEEPDVWEDHEGPCGEFVPEQGDDEMLPTS